MPHKHRRHAEQRAVLYAFLMRLISIRSRIPMCSYAPLGAVELARIEPNKSKGAAMKAHYQRGVKAPLRNVSPYSAPLSVLVLLLAGMLVKFGPALHIFHAQN